MKKKIKTYKKEYEQLKKTLDEAHLCYLKLSEKYSIAVNTLGTLACKTCSSMTPKEWDFDSRMAWTASDTLQRLAKRTSPEFPL